MRSRAPTPSRLTALCRPRRREGTKEKAPPKEGRDQHLGYAGDGLPSRCIRRYRLPSRCTRKKFHARPEQGNGPAADGASFSLTTQIYWSAEGAAFSFRYQDNSGLGESFRPLSSPASVNCVRPEGLSRRHENCGAWPDSAKFPVIFPVSRGIWGRDWGSQS
jgi:hypothetical protein